MGGDFIGFFRGHFGENVSEFRVFVLDTCEIGSAKYKNFAICQGPDGSRAFFPENQGEVSEVVAILQRTVGIMAVIGGNFNLSPADKIYFFAYLAFTYNITVGCKSLRLQCSQQYISERR